MGEQLGLAIWCQDEAGPFKTEPYAAESWAPEGKPARHPHEHLRNGTAKLLTLFHPATGEVRGKGVVSTANAVLHPWLKAELTAILDRLPAPPSTLSPAQVRELWEQWQEGLSIRMATPADPPPLRMLLIWDNLAGHYTPELILCRLLASSARSRWYRRPSNIFLIAVCALLERTCALLLLAAPPVQCSAKQELLSGAADNSSSPGRSTRCS